MKHNTTPPPAAHTPGPWIADLQRDLDKTHGTDISIFAKTPIHGNPQWLARVYGPGALAIGMNGERDANVRLIAAAPDLLAALQRTLRQIEILKDIAKIMKPSEAELSARAALARAEGK
jgi:hypothetical protein